MYYMLVQIESSANYLIPICLTCWLYVCFDMFIDLDRSIYSDVYSNLDGFRVSKYRNQPVMPCHILHKSLQYRIDHRSADCLFWIEVSMMMS